MRTEPYSERELDVQALSAALMMGQAVLGLGFVFAYWFMWVMHWRAFGVGWESISATMLLIVLAAEGLWICRKFMTSGVGGATDRAFARRSRMTYRILGGGAWIATLSLIIWQCLIVSEMYRGLAG